MSSAGEGEVVKSVDPRFVRGGWGELVWIDCGMVMLKMEYIFGVIPQDVLSVPVKFPVYSREKGLCFEICVNLRCVITLRYVLFSPTVQYVLA